MVYGSLGVLGGIGHMEFLEQVDVIACWNLHDHRVAIMQVLYLVRVRVALAASGADIPLGFVLPTNEGDRGPRRRFLAPKTPWQVSLDKTSRSSYKLNQYTLGSKIIVDSHLQRFLRIAECGNSAVALNCEGVSGNQRLCFNQLKQKVTNENKNSYPHNNFAFERM